MSKPIHLHVLRAALLFGGASTLTHLDSAGRSASATPCFVAITVVLAAEHPYSIHRVVTTGVRRYEDSGGGTVGSCAPADKGAIAAARRAVDTRVDSTRGALHVEHVIVRSTSADVVSSHLVRIAARASTDTVFAGAEVVNVNAPDGSAVIAMPLPPLTTGERQRSRCWERNAMLQQGNASFHWAC